MNKVKTKREVYNSFKPYMKNIAIFRNDVNEYGEKDKDIYVTEIEGYYSLAKNLIVVNYTHSGAINKNYNEMISVMISDDSFKIKQDDYFNINNTNYRIINIQNVMDIYLDFTLERV